jgi:hypothetical protein
MRWREIDDSIRPRCAFSGGIRGKYAVAFAQGPVVVVLDKKPRSPGR